MNSERDLDLEGPGLQVAAREVAQIVRHLWPGRRLGFAFLVFDIGQAPGHLAYVSDAAREDMVKALRECATRLATRTSHYGDPPVSN